MSPSLLSGLPISCSHLYTLPSASIENALIKFLSSKDGLGDNLDSVQYDTYKTLAKRKAKELINIIYPNTFKL